MFDSTGAQSVLPYPTLNRVTVPSRNKSLHLLKYLNTQRYTCQPLNLISEFKAGDYVYDPEDKKSFQFEDPECDEECLEDCQKGGWSFNCSYECDCGR